jgi:hypothetical protein
VNDLTLTRKQLDGLRGGPSGDNRELTAAENALSIPLYTRRLTGRRTLSREGKCTELGREQLSRAQSHRRGGEQRSPVAATRPTCESLS